MEPEEPMELGEAVGQLQAYADRGPSASREACRVVLAALAGCWVREAELEEQLRNSEIFRRNVIREYRDLRREVGQLLETWDNMRGLVGDPAVTQERLRRRIEDLRPWSSGVLREDDDGAPLPPAVQG